MTGTNNNWSDFFSYTFLFFNLSLDSKYYVKIKWSSVSGKSYYKFNWKVFKILLAARIKKKNGKICSPCE